MNILNSNKNRKIHVVPSGPNMGQQRHTNWPEVLEADVEVLNLLEEVTEEGGVATSVSQEPRSGSANTKGEKSSIYGWDLW